MKSILIAPKNLAFLLSPGKFFFFLNFDFWYFGSHSNTPLHQCMVLVQRFWMLTCICNSLYWLIFITIRDHLVDEKLPFIYYITWIGMRPSPQKQLDCITFMSYHIHVPNILCKQTNIFCIAAWFMSSSKKKIFSQNCSTHEPFKKCNLTLAWDQYLANNLIFRAGLTNLTFNLYAAELFWGLGYVDQIRGRQRVKAILHYKSFFPDMIFFKWLFF